MGDSLNSIINEFKLEPIKFCCQKYFTKESIESFAQLEILNDMFQRTVIQMSTEILSEFIDPDIEEIVIERIVVEDWFQHFKLSVFPRWLLKRFPVKTKTIKNTYKVSVKGLYPTIAVTPPCFPYLKLFQITKEENGKINKRQAKIIIENITGLEQSTFIK
jgi:hypothetical protein